MLIESHITKIIKDSSLYQLIYKLWEPKKFHKNFDIIYHKQVPNTGIMLINGTVTAGETEINETCIFGLKELLLKKEIETTIKIHSNSIASIIDEQSLLNNFHKNPQLKKELESLLNVNL